MTGRGTNCVSGEQASGRHGSQSRMVTEGPQSSAEFNCCIERGIWAVLPTKQMLGSQDERVYVARVRGGDLSATREVSSHAWELTQFSQEGTESELKRSLTKAWDV